MDCSALFEEHYIKEGKYIELILGPIPMEGDGADLCYYINSCRPREGVSGHILYFHLVDRKIGDTGNAY